MTDPDWSTARRLTDAESAAARPHLTEGVPKICVTIPCPPWETLEPGWPSRIWRMVGLLTRCQKMRRAYRAKTRRRAYR